DAAGRIYTTHIHVGQPAEVIAKLATELACDLILMGTHGRSRIAGLVMGSVASRVLHLAACPVLLIK
ncbi:MAG: universal stress protein, partial [Azonexus sp.]|nr:universal stress protein [Azonexus sp.]